MWAIADITFCIYKLFFGMGKEIHLRVILYLHLFLCSLDCVFKPLSISILENIQQVKHLPHVFEEFNMFELNFHSFFM